MDALTSVAASGLRSRLEALDLLANNLANSSTPGFKADREAYSLYLGAESAEADANWTGYAQPKAPDIETHRTDFSQGQLTVTGESTDLALSGRGFFQVDGSSGPLLTRNGRLKIDTAGRLVTPDGYEYATVEPRRIRANRDLPISVSPQGEVSQDGEVLGHLKVVDTPSGTQPAKRDGVYFSIDKNDVKSLTASTAEVRQGQVEAANFSPAEASVKLVSVLRQFEALQKAIQIGSEMGRRAIEDVAKVS